MKKEMNLVWIGIGVVFLVLLVGVGLTGYIVLPSGPSAPNIGDLGERDVAESSGVGLDGVDDETVTQGEIDELAGDIGFILEEEDVENLVIEEVVGVIEENLGSLIGEEITDAEIDNLVDEVEVMLEEGNVGEEIIEDIKVVIEEEIGEVELELVCGEGYEMNFDRCIKLEEIEDYKEEFVEIDLEIEELVEEEIVEENEIEGIVNSVEDILVKEGVEQEIVETVRETVEESLENSVGVEVTKERVEEILESVQEELIVSEIEEEVKLGMVKDVEEVIEERVFPRRTIKIVREKTPLVNLNLKSADSERTREIKIIRSKVSERREFVIVRNIVLNRDESKTIYIQRKSGESNAVCVNDNEGLEVVDDILEDCLVVPCPGRTGDYKCRVNKATNTFVVYGLSHSGVIEDVLRCGDGFCDSGESCSSCEDDCGLCQVGISDEGVEWKISDEAIKWSIIIGGVLLFVVVVFSIVKIYNNRSRIPEVGIKIITKENPFNKFRG